MKSSNCDAVIEKDVEQPIISRLPPRSDDHIPEAIPYNKKRVRFTEKTFDNIKGYFNWGLESYQPHLPVDEDTVHHPR